MSSLDKYAQGRQGYFKKKASICGVIQKDKETHTYGCSLYLKIFLSKPPTEFHLVKKETRAKNTEFWHLEI